MSGREKARFMQHTAPIFICCHPSSPDAARAIEFSEALWQKLTAKGYGTAQTKEKARVGVNYYEQLSVHQKKWFCMFWKVFKHNQGKQNAARRWGELGELTEEQYRGICAAAEAEGKRTLPQGQTRKMAEGWINERRWEDSQPDTKELVKKADPRQAELIEAKQQLMHAQNQFNNTQDTYWSEEVTKYTLLIDKLKG